MFYGDGSTEALETYLRSAGWEEYQPGFWRDPLECDTCQPIGEAELIQMRRDGLPLPEQEP
jgi:hypothetical protein